MQGRKLMPGLYSRNTEWLYMTHNSAVVAETSKSVFIVDASTE